ncbi:S8 family peptidase [Salegentibacter sp. JZCK2]|uniref:S8 family peptidase n=1 Tax=Salegentibacter tibetensis TaxID=2873600 RepID=UPI001CCAA629|nr:S8 family peptidase [Salegentibacter tibetensis]MBZ9728259.1 S8 family peptidase [Salegentibacter tibetensis]
MILKNFYKVFAIFFAMALMTSCSKEETAVEPKDPNALDNYDEPIQGQYIVVYKDQARQEGKSSLNKQAVQSKTKSVLAENNLTDVKILNIYANAINGATLSLTESQASALAKNEKVAYVEQDRVITLAPPSNGDQVETSSTQEMPYGIARVNGVTGYSGSGVAWVIDTGIDLDHEDLNVDASRGFNAFTRGRDGKSLDDGNGHGSHVAGTIAALNNGVGVIGVAPGATVIPVKVLDSRGSGSYSGVIAGVDHVAANGTSGDVANMSLGGPISQALDDAVLSASQNGILFALAAGNDSDDANNYSPARVNGTNIFTISAMNSSDVFASFSNYGNPPVDYCAPGVSIKSTWKDGGYNTISGTSMASPHAAGVLLLGNATTDGYVGEDPDNNPDPIIVH